MKSKILILLISLMSYSIAYAQQKVIFNEDFEGYDNDWRLISNEEFLVKQEEGKLFISKTNINAVKNGCLWYKKTMPNFYAEKNFSIKFDAKSMNSEAEWGYFDIQWGRMQEFDGVRKTSIYQIDFGSNKVRLAKFELGKGWKYFQWSNELDDLGLSKFSIEKGVFNNFEIIQQNGILIVKMNGDLIYKLPIVSIVGSEIGFQQCLKGVWELDNFIIQQ